MKKYILIVAIISVCLIAFSAFHAEEYNRSVSPDGKYIAIAKYHAFRAWIPMMPGGSGDKSGWIEVFSKDGKYFGSHSVEMVSFIQEIEWSRDSAYLKFAGEWNLD